MAEAAKPVLDPMWLHSLADVAKMRGMDEIPQGMRLALPRAVTDDGLLRDVAIVVDSTRRVKDNYGFVTCYVYDAPIRTDTSPKAVLFESINTPLFL